MKLSVDRVKFLESFAAAAQVAPQRTPKPVLRNVKAVATPNEVRLSATDMEFSLEIDADGADVFSPGQCLLPAARMLSILREMREETIVIEVVGAKATVKGGKSKFEFQTEDSDLFPLLPELPEELPLLTLPAHLLRGLLRKTIFATDEDSPRYALGGVCFEFSESALHAIGTDSRRLSHAAAPVEGEAFPGFGSAVIVPQHSCRMIERLVGDEGNVSIGVCANDFVVQTATATVRTRLLEGRFPKWRDVIPDRGQMQRVAIGRDAILAALSQVSIVCTAENRGVDFAISQGALNLSARSVEHGVGEAEIEIVSDIDDLTTCYDFRFAKDFLKSTDAESVDLYVSDGNRAGLFIDGEGHDYVLMPLELKSAESNRETAAESKQRKAG